MHTFRIHTIHVHFAIKSIRIRISGHFGLTAHPLVSSFYISDTLRLNVLNRCRTLFSNSVLCIPVRVRFPGSGVVCTVHSLA